MTKISNAIFFNYKIIYYKEIKTTNVNIILKIKNNE
jgi:hypothetical protein